MNNPRFVVFTLLIVFIGEVILSNHHHHRHHHHKKPQSQKVAIQTAIKRDPDPPAARRADTGTTNPGDDAALKLANKAESKAQDSEADNFVEGDIHVSDIVKKIREKSPERWTKDKKSELAKELKWPTTDENDKIKVIVPYSIPDTFDSNGITAINEAIADLRENTCVRFEPKSKDQEDFVSFTEVNGMGCWSYLGRKKGSQEINIGVTCRHKGSVIHQIMHTLGFLHEHTRPDSDDFLTRHEGLIKEGMKDNFKKYQHILPASENEKSYSYDYKSIMHVDRFAYSNTGDEITIEPSDSGTNQNELGQRTRLSETDIEKIKDAYCKKSSDSSGNAAYADWPTDYAWLDIGYPSVCPCNYGVYKKSTVGKCKSCKCLNFKSQQTPKAWDDNKLCMTNSKKKNPNFQLFRSGSISGKRCLLIDDAKEWDNLHLCHDNNAPYKLAWSDVDVKNSHGSTRCLKIKEKDDSTWNKTYLCSMHNI